MAPGQGSELSLVRISISGATAVSARGHRIERDRGNRPSHRSYFFVVLESFQHAR
jgi:hypothetical protein